VEYSAGRRMLIATFSIVARSPETFSLGVGVSTAVPAVGSVVPHAETSIGAVATQGLTDPSYGVEGLKLLRGGWSPKEALEELLRRDLMRELRQVSIIDSKGRAAAHTGKDTIEWSGHLVGRDYVVAGNMLRGSFVLEGMAEAFGRSTGLLSERILSALEAGDEAGGDRRGKISAALLVVGEEVMGPRPAIDLRVDYHREPVHELRRVFEAYKRWSMRL